MAELYIYDQDDKFKNIITEETGLVSTWFKDYQNHIVDESFIFHVDVESNLLNLIVEENQVAFYDRDNDLRLMRIKEVYEVGGAVKAVCEPAFLELYDHFIEDRRIVNGTAQTALNRGLEGSRYVGEVTVDLGLATDNFYWINGVEVVFKIINTWGGALKDTITLDENNEIVERKLWILQRLGTDNGLIVEPDYNAESIERKTLSYVETALWGQGASLETEDGGYTRYITFEDVEWKVSNGDPVDKPKGQKWVGDPQALAEHGYLHNRIRQHRYGHFSNQDYETPEELLMATWMELQDRKLKEVIHEAVIYESDKKVSLGDTVTILDRRYNKPIELQSQITGLEYDLLWLDEITIIIGKYIDMSENPLEKEVESLKKEVVKPRPTKPIDNNSYPDIKPDTPVNVTADGGFQTIMISWDYDYHVYVSYYEVYGSQIADFVPDSQQLLWRGDVSSYAHEVNTDETWYYRVRAVNTRGTASDFSNQVSASSIRINTPDIMFGAVKAQQLADNLELADKLSQGTVDWINEDVYTDIRDTENRILADLSSQLGDVFNDINGLESSVNDLLDRTSSIEGSVINVNKTVDEMEGTLATTVQQLTNLDGIVSDHSTTLTQHYNMINARITRDEFNTTTGDLLNQITNIDVKADGISTSVSRLQADLDGLEIGGTNLNRDSNNFSRNVWTFYDGSRMLEHESNYEVDEWGTTDATRIKAHEGDGTSVLKVFKQITHRTNTVEGETYTISFYVKNLRDISMSVNINGILPRPTIDIGPNEAKRVVATGVRGVDALQLQFRSNTANHYTEFAVWRAQVEEGTIATAWSPAPEDTDQKLSDLDYHITQVDIKADNIQTSVTNIQGSLGDALADISLIDQKANSISISVSKIEGSLEDWGVGNRNLFVVSALGEFLLFWLAELRFPIEDGATHLTYSRNGPQLDGDVVVAYYATQSGNQITTETFANPTLIRTVAIPANAKYFSFLVAGDIPNKQQIFDAKIKLEFGQEVTPYALAPEDQSGVDRAVAFINVSSDGLRLHGDRVQITGQTLIEEGVIGTAAIADAAIKRAHLQDAIIDTAQISNLAVSTAKIANLAVDTGKLANLAVTNAKIASLNVDKLTGSIATFIEEGFNDVTNQVSITGSGLETYSGEQRTSLLDGTGHRFYRDNRYIGHIGTSNWQADVNYRGLRFGLENNANYMSWGFKETASADAYTTMLAWHKTGAKQDKGFTFSDNVRIMASEALKVTRFRTDYASSRIMKYVNMTFNGNDGVSLLREGTNGYGGLFMTTARSLLIATGTDGTSGLEVNESGVLSLSIYGRTYSTNTQLVRVTVNGYLGRVESSRRIKLLEKPITVDYAMRILDLDAKTWYDKRAVEDYAHTLSTGQKTEEQDIVRYPGLIAEDVEDAGLGMYVSYDDEGLPNGINGNLWTLLIPVLKHHINETEDNFDDLKLKHDLLKQKVNHMEHRINHLENILEVA